ERQMRPGRNVIAPAASNNHDLVEIVIVQGNMIGTAGLRWEKLDRPVPLNALEWRIQVIAGLHPAESDLPPMHRAKAQGSFQAKSHHLAWNGCRRRHRTILSSP